MTPGRGQARPGPGTSLVRFMSLCERLARNHSAIDARRPAAVIPVCSYVVIWPAGLQPRKRNR